MHRQKCYDTCRRYFGKVVRIEDRDGRIHLGKIIDVTKALYGLNQYNSAHLLIQVLDTMTHMQTVVVIFAAALADVIVVDLDAVVDSVAAVVVVVVVVIVVAAAGEAAVVAGVLNSDLVSSSELHWLHYFSFNIVKS